MVDMGTIGCSSGKGRSGMSGWNGGEKVVRRELAMGGEIVKEMRRMDWIRLKITEDDNFKIRVG